MALRFLQAKEDVIAFVDFLYDQGYCIARSGGPLEGILLDRSSASDALTSDLVIGTAGGCYWIVTMIEDRAYIILELESCGGWSHPRCTDRMCRYSGHISHCYGREKTEQGEALLKDIKKFFQKEKYVFQHCQRFGRECSFFGPHYQKLDEEYAQNPEPTWLCPGYIRIVCGPQHVDTVTERMETLLPQYPAIRSNPPVCKAARDKKDQKEVYISFLCDRREFGIEELTELVDRLGYAPGRAIGRKEGRFIRADTAYRNRKYLDVKWNTYGYVENEWKGFEKSEDAKGHYHLTP